MIHCSNYRSRKYLVDESFFSSIDSETKAYVLGYLFADGCIRDSYSFEVTSIDEYLVNIVKQALQAQHPVTQRYLGDKKRQLQHTLTIGSKILIGQLVELGCLQSKSLKQLRMPCINPSLTQHFIRGHFDGNGDAYVDALGNVSIRFVGSYSLLNDFKMYFHNASISSKAVIIPHGKVHRFGYKGNVLVSRIVTLLYTNAQYFLQRKYSKLVKCLVSRRVRNILGDATNGLLENLRE